MRPHANLTRIPQIAAAAGSADVVALFLAADPGLSSITKAATGNTLLHYAALGPPHVADIFKTGEGRGG